MTHFINFLRDYDLTTQQVARSIDLIGSKKRKKKYILLDRKILETVNEINCDTDENIVKFMRKISYCTINFAKNLSSKAVPQNEENANEDQNDG